MFPDIRKNITFFLEFPGLVCIFPSKSNQTKVPVEKLVPLQLYPPNIWRCLAGDMARHLGVWLSSKLYINIQFVPHREQGPIPLKEAAYLLT